MKTLLLILLYFSTLSNVQADLLSLQVVLNLNAGIRNGKYLGHPESDCSVQVYLPGEFVETDSNYWVLNDWLVATEFASYPNAEVSGGFAWDFIQAQNIVRFYLDSNKKSYRDFNYDAVSMEFTQFSVVSNGVRGNTCILE